MKNKHRIWLSLFCIIIGLVCALIYNSSSYVDAQGMLHEYFFLVPLAWILIITGSIVKSR
ncbi:DUF3955 domain-containing protein [Limosilactobacillus sp.]|uniref:DUF3955 domain-containing protein n=1 Tax=Limosilactobacillus sp. TaxID=2773925 RepID=UPI003F0847D2